MDLTLYTHREIVAAIMRRDTAVTKEYLYRKCRPLFESCFNRYYTDCENCIEFINEIYLYIMLPSKKTGKNKISTFGFRCTLTMWMKVVTENYCRQLFKRKAEHIGDNNDIESDRNIGAAESLNIDALNRRDVEKVLSLMRNKRYSALIRYRYLDDKTNEETAELLGMSMDNYYNKHKRAKQQFAEIIRKEGLI